VSRQARRRLLSGVALIVIVFAAGVFWLVRSQGAYYRQVGELGSGTLDGRTVKVGGTVVDGSVRRQQDAMVFTISDLTGADKSVRVRCSAALPSAFGSGVQVVVLGVYHAADGLITADEVQTKCPSKYKDRASPAPSAAT